MVVKPSQGSEMIDESLNENRASISTGPNRISRAKAIMRTLAMPGSRRRILIPRPGRLRGGAPLSASTFTGTGKVALAHPAATSCQARS